MMPRTIVAICITLVVLTACRRTIHCSDQAITPVFVHFSASDLDTLIVRKYKKDDNFLHLYDTVLITNNPGVAGYSVSNDTTVVELNIISGEMKYLLPANDWQIYIPAKNMTVSLANIISPPTTYSCFGDNCGCINPIRSFEQNGQLIFPHFKFTPYFGYRYVTYIHS